MSTQPFSPADHAWMAKALEAAEQAIGLSDPNPRVGCVLVRDDGAFAVGHTQAAGQAHAEVMALRAAQSAGWDARGATAYITLEPCSHHGRTPPCCDALVQAGVKRVVVAAEDPNPVVAGQGLQRLRAADIEAQSGLMAEATCELNIGFFSRMLRRRPWVRLKIAASLDGRTALPDGRSQWITSEAARQEGHAWRRRASAVLTGVDTVLKDDPTLDVRWVATVHQPLRVVVDSKLRTPVTARLFETPAAVLIYTATDDAARTAALQARGATVIPLADQRAEVNLAAMLDDLAVREVNELHVEAGATLNGALLEAGLVDELLIFLAPSFLGDGLSMAKLQPLRQLADRSQWHFTDVTRIGEDVRLLARQRQGDPFNPLKAF